MRQDGVQQHPAVAGREVVGPFEEQRIALGLEGLEGTDADDPVDRLVELLQPCMRISIDAVGVELGQPLAGVLRLRLCSA